MRPHPSTALIQSIKTELLSENPGVEELLCTLRSEYRIEQDNAVVLLYNIVRELNSKMFPPIRKLELMLTLNCNLKCSYCFEQPIRSRRKISPAMARSAVDLLYDYCGDEKELYISLFGGEPTLNYSTLRNVTQYAEKKARRTQKKVHFNMTTNGVALSDAMIEYFAAHNIKVLLSIDGLKSSHDRFRTDLRGDGTYERVIDTMKRLKKRMPWIGIKMTISKENLPHLCAEVVALYDMGINQFIIGPATNDEWRDQDTDLYLQQMKRLRQWYLKEKRDDLRIHEFEDEPRKESYFGCQAGRDSISVDVDGAVTGCSKIRSLESADVVGKLGDVRFGLTHLKKRRDFISCELLKKNWRALGIKQNYIGGCFASNYQKTKDVFSPDLFEHAFAQRLRHGLKAENNTADQ